MSTAEKTRQTGKSAVQEALEAQREDQDQPLDPELPGEETPRARIPGFGRIRTDWSGEDGRTMRQVHDQVSEIIFDSFTSLYVVLHEIYSVIRTPQMHGDTPVLDALGMQAWVLDEFGEPVEDWSKLNRGEMKRFIQMINVKLFAWQEMADRFRGEALMAKTQWEESFAEGWFEASGTGRGTDAGKTESAKKSAFEERYFAVFKTYLSHRADSVVGSMKQIEQRFKDLYIAGT